MDNDKDSLIVACSMDNFQNIFLKEQAWYPIRIAKNRANSLKYLFAYQKSPIGAITYLAEIERNVPQNPRYCNSSKTLQAQTMDSIY